MARDASLQLLNECRNLMTSRMRGAMGRMMGYVEDVLFEMARVDDDPQNANHYIDAVREIRIKKREIQVRFEDRFVKLFRDKLYAMQTGQVEAESEPAGTGTHPAGDQQNGFNPGTMQETLDKTRDECRIALATLDRHVSNLFETEEVEKFVNPMQPGTVLGAFWDSCRDIRGGQDIRLLLVDMFERHVVSDLQAVYDDMNTLFGYYVSGLSGDADVQKHVAGRDEAVSVESFETGNLKAGGSILIRGWVEGHVRERLKDKDVPGFIEEFLLGPWRLVLEDIYEKSGEDTMEWERAMQVIDDLIRCANVDISRQSRNQQIWLLPGLIYRLKAGMKNAGLPLKTQADFLSELKTLHGQMAELGRRQSH